MCRSDEAELDGTPQPRLWGFIRSLSWSLNEILSAFLSDF